MIRGKVGGGLPAKQALGLGLGYSSNQAVSWREQLLSTMDMQTRHDNRVFAKPIERVSHPDASHFNDSQSSLTSDGTPQYSLTHMSTSVSQGSGTHGAMKKLNVRNSERSTKDEKPGKIFNYLSRKRQTSEDISRERDREQESSSGSVIATERSSLEDKERGKEKRKSMRLRRSTQSMDTIDDNAPTVLSSSFEKSNMLPWESRRLFGPGLRVATPTDAPPSPTSTALSSLRLAISSPKAAAEPPRQFPLNRSRAQSTTSSASSNAQTIVKQSSTASFSSEEGATSGGSPRLKDSPLSHMSTLSTSPPRPGLSFTKRAGIRSRKELSSRDVGMHRQVTASSRGPLSPEPLVYKAPTTPFDLREITSQSYYQNLTHNRRRWSHLFPTGKFSKPTAASTRKQTLEAVSEVEQRSSNSWKGTDETTVTSGETMRYVLNDYVDWFDV